MAEHFIVVLEGPQPGERKRHVSMALRAYAAMATSAAKGAVRIVP